MVKYRASKGNNVSCGCGNFSVSRVSDYVGKKAGMLTATKMLNRVSSGLRYLWKCDCGNEY